MRVGLAVRSTTKRVTASRASPPPGSNGRRGDDSDTTSGNERSLSTSFTTSWSPPS